MKAKTSPSVEPSQSRLALSRAEAAAALGIHPNTLDNLVRRGLLVPNRATRRPIFPVWEIERFLQAHSVAA